MFFKKKNQDGKPKAKKPLWKRILKWTGISFLLLFIMVLLLPFIFEKQIFEMVKGEINKNLHGKFECEDYSLTLISTFPNFTLELKNVKLSGEKEFEGVDLINAEDMIFTIDLYSVLWGDNIDIREVGIKKPDINVIVLENGKANYDIVKSDSTKIAEGTDTSETKFALKVREYYIENGNITYDDRAGKMYARMVNLNHKGEGDFTQDLFEFKTTTTADTIDFVYDDIAYIHNTKADIQMNLDMDMPKMKFTFKDNVAKLNALDVAFNGFLTLAEEMEMDLSFESKKTDFGSLFSMIPAAYTEGYDKIKFGGNASFKGRINGIYSATSMPSMNINLDVDNGSFQYPGMPKSATGIFMKANVNSKGDVTMNDMVIDVAKMSMNFGGNSISGYIKLVTLMTDPGITTGIHGDFDLATIKDVVPLSEGESYTGKINADVKINGHQSAIDKGNYEAFEANGSIIATDVNYSSKDMPYPTTISSAGLYFSPQELVLSDFKATVDKSQISADGKMNNYLAYFLRGDNLKGEFNIASPEIDMADFLGEPNADATAATTTTTIASSPATESYVFIVPKNIDFKLGTSIGKLKYPNDPGKPEILLENVNGAVNMNEGVMTLDNLSFNTLDGSMKMNGTYATVNEKEPDVDMNFTMSNLDIKKTAATFNTIDKIAPIASKCTGKFSTDMKFKAKLNDKMEPQMNTLTGGGRMQTKSVYVEGFEPLNKLAEKLKISRLAKQTINDVNISYEFRDGRVWVDDYDVKIANYKTTIGGSTGFDQTLDYKVDLAVPRSEFGTSANSALNELVSKANQKTGTNVELSEIVNIRAKVTGTATDPKIETDLKDHITDMKEDIKEVIKEKVEEKIEEVKEDVKAKASEEAEKILKEAELKAAQIRSEAKKAADKVRAEGKSSGDKLIEEAGNNPLKKTAAQKAAEKLNKEAEEKATKMEKEADEKAQKVLDEAKEKADKLK